MKYFLLIPVVSLILSCNNSKKVDEPVNNLVNLTTETAENKEERNAAIELINKELLSQGIYDFSLKMSHFLLKDNFAFFKGDLSKKDGSEYEVADPDYNDCCHVEGLLKKEGNLWKAITINAFSTDVWYGCLWKEKNAPKDIFDYADACN